MTLQLHSNSIVGNVPVDLAEPAGQLSTGSYAVVTGSELDATVMRSVAYTIGIATNSVFWKVFGANASDYSDEVEVLAETSVAAGAFGSYAVAPPPFRFYRVKIKNNAGAGTATVRGIAKR